MPNDGAGSTGGALISLRNRQANLKRRRQMAASGAMPASLAGKFTLGGDAALCIIADECRVRGSSDLSLDEIADKASVGRSVAKSALRKARELGLITVQNRGRLTNVVRIIAPEWLAWLQLGDGERRRLVDTRLTATFGFCKTLVQTTLSWRTATWQRRSLTRCRERSRLSMTPQSVSACPCTAEHRPPQRARRHARWECMKFG